MNTLSLADRLSVYRAEHKLSLSAMGRQLRLSAYLLRAIEEGVQPALGTQVRIEALIGAPPPTDWCAAAQRLEAECARLAEEARALRAENEQLEAELQAVGKVAVLFLKMDIRSNND